MTNTTASTQSGALRVERDLRRAIHHTEAGRVAVPVLVSLAADGPAMDAELILPGGDAENMCAEIDALLHGGIAEAATSPRRAARTRGRRAALQDTTFDAPGG